MGAWDAGMMIGVEENEEFGRSRGGRRSLVMRDDAQSGMRWDVRV